MKPSADTIPTATSTAPAARRREGATMAARIDRLTAELDCTQAELAAVLEVSATMISRYKAGRSQWPGWIVIRISICEARLGLDPAQRTLQFPGCLRGRLHGIARETVAGVERLLRRERRRWRAWR